jgi:hypothetical protein
MTAHFPVLEQALEEKCGCIKLVVGVKPIIHQSELTKVVPFNKNSSFRFVVL